MPYTPGSPVYGQTVEELRSPDPSTLPADDNWKLSQVDSHPASRLPDAVTSSGKTTVEEHIDFRRRGFTGMGPGK